MLNHEVGLRAPRDTDRSARRRAVGFRKSAFRIRHSARAGLAVVLAACGLVVWHGFDRVPTGAASGFQLESPDGLALRTAGNVPPKTLAGPRDTLRVATFNIHGGRGTDGVRDLDRTADLLRGFDLIGLNEVHGSRALGVDNQAARLGDTLDQLWLFAPTERRWWRDDFGNGVLSSLPVDRWLRMPLPSSQDAGFRNVVLLVVPWRGVTVNVLVTHIDRQRDRESQLRAVFALFQSLAKPVILLGDFNSPPTDSLIRELLAGSDAHDALESLVNRGGSLDRIDWIVVRGLKAVDVGRVATIASDHPLLWTELQLDAASSLTEKNGNQ